MKIAVLGCGPAGLMAAHGASEAHVHHSDGDFYLDIFSRKVKSGLFGAQYLHRPIPSIQRVARTTIDYRLRGDADAYRRKVYGQMWDGSVSPEDMTSMHEAWDIRATYDSLWHMYSPAVRDHELDPVGVHAITPLYDLVITSIPMPALCYGNHHFGSTDISAAGDAPALGIDIGKTFRCSDDTVICNAEPNPSWYRMSRIFGHTTVEWPSGVTVPVSSASVVRKPTFTDCDCFKGVLRVGRYGTWKKGVLSHEAFSDAYRKVERMLSRERV